jgi:hypothetical protein
VQRSKKKAAIDDGELDDSTEQLETVKDALLAHS